MIEDGHKSREKDSPQQAQKGKRRKVGMEKKQSAEIDSLLEPLLSPASDQQVDDIVSQLIAQHAEPVIKGIISYKLHLYCHHTIGNPDASDIYQEAIVQLLEALHQLRKEPDANPVSDLRGLAAVIAHRVCARWMRQQFPGRHAFKNRLYYILTHQRGLALWQNENKKLVAGFSVWQGEKKGAAEWRLEQLSNDEELLSRIRSLKTRKESWSGTLAAIFDFLGAPVEFDRLIRAMAALLQFEDQPLESIEQIRDTIGLEASARGPDTAWQVEKRIFLQNLLEEIRQLPLNHRVALLLNLRDSEGGGGIALFPALRIATVHQLAEVLEMSGEKLAEMWNELPLGDARIAELLHLTRQQVINVRKAARKRLTRQLKGFI
jgi:DNA-directed RNA polymerase specialized sigma24 family protein